MNKIITLATVATLAACSQVPEKTNTSSLKTTKIEYPNTRKGDAVDTYFGKRIADPYRWLEDDRSAETEAWVKAENKVTQAYLKQIPYRDKIEKVVSKLINYEKVTAPFKEGNYTYFYKNDGLQNQYVVYRQLGDQEPEVFLDPNTFSDDGTVSMSSLTFTEDGSLAAYQLSEGGSDWRTVVVIDTESKKQLEVPLQNVKFSGLAWVNNDGFYYSSYDKPEGSELSAKTDQHKLYYHKLGTPQSQDKVVFGGTEAQKHRYVGADVDGDSRFLAISAATSTSGNKLYVQDLHKTGSELVEVLENTNSDSFPVTVEGDTIYIKTNLNAPNGRLIKVDASNPTPENWQDVIPQTDNVLSVTRAGNYLFANYMQDAVSKVKQYDLNGKLVREVDLPGAGSASGFSAKRDEKHTYFTFANYKTPGTIYKMQLDSGKVEVYRESGAEFDSNSFVSKQVFYRSKDGTKIPMLITHHKDAKLDGSNPTILYGYGGFNVSLTPRFSSTIAAWLELGGIYAVANIRGGGEYGKKWHKAGTQLNKQNVFDDFIAAGEYLISEKYTRSAKLAISGGSNGGLLVGAVMTQRPDLIQVALPAVGVLDMLRYHTFTAGAGWAYDYGTSEQSKEMFDYLLGYSPVHNVKAGVEYPATMVTTADHDDRVVPAHSFKFAAELQAKQSGNNPVLIRIESDAGHGAGTPTSKIIEQYADIYGFTLFNMGIKNL